MREQGYWMCVLASRRPKCLRATGFTPVASKDCRFTTGGRCYRCRVIPQRQIGQFFGHGDKPSGSLFGLQKGQEVTQFLRGEVVGEAVGHDRFIARLALVDVVGMDVEHAAVLIGKFDAAVHFVADVNAG